jgi:hypothetical protein
MVQAGQMAAHLEHEHRKRQREPDPEAPAHVDQLFVRSAIRGRQHGLQRHAADRAGAGPDLADLRVHRAGVDRACRNARRALPRGLEILRRIGLEFGEAAGGTEIVGPAGMLVTVLCAVRIDRHPAHRIAHPVRGRIARMRRIRRGVMMIVRAAATTGAVRWRSGAVRAGRHRHVPCEKPIETYTQ